MNMNPIEILKSTYPELTKKEKLIADLILENPKIVMQTTSDSLALEASSSKSSIIRMCQKMGFSGYTDLKYAITRYLTSNQSEQPQQSSFMSIIQKYCQQISTITEHLTSEDLENLAKKIIESKHIKTFGFNRSGLSAKQLKMRLSKIGINCECIEDHVILNDALNYGTNEDVLLIFSVKGNNPIFPMVFADKKRDEGIEVVLVTMTPKCPLSKQASSVISLPNISRTETQAYLDDQVIFFVFIELLLNTLTTITFQNSIK